MNTIGIEHNLDRARIRKLLAIGLLGFFGIFLEGLSCFAVYRLMADAAPKYAHLYRAGIFGYIWLAPVGCHLNMGVLNLAYKYLLRADEALAAKAADLLFYGFSLPVYLLLVIFWLPMMIIQFKVFSKGLTPYPMKAKWFCVPDMHAWQLCHLAMVVPIADAYYETADPEHAGRDAALMRKTAKQIRDNLDAIAARKIRLSPGKMQAFRLLPTPASTRPNRRRNFSLWPMRHKVWRIIS